MTSTTKALFQVESGNLICRLTPAQLGFAPQSVWNPSPSVDHRVTPWPLPKSLEIGIFGNPDTAAKYSPPPLAVGVLSGATRAIVMVVCDPGWHLFNDVVFETTSQSATVHIDLDGQADATQVAQHARVVIFPGQPDEPLMPLLARALASAYPAAAAKPANPDPAWWNKPIYCGWGDQVTSSQWLQGVGPEHRAIAFAIQGMYQRWINRLDSANVPIGTIIIDAGWSPTGSLKPDLDRWPDLKGFIKRQHDKGRKVLLWAATWLMDGLPDEWCLFCDGVKLCADPTNPAYRAYLRNQVHQIISPDGFDADGFKIDQLAYSPSYSNPRGGYQFGRSYHLPPPKSPFKFHTPGVWGIELLHQLQHDIYASAKAAKPDCLVTSSTVHPYFHDTLDMVRLHDMGNVATDIFEAMGARADLGKAALPHKPIDTDDWVHSDYDLWLRYTSGSRVLGVPCIFYAERFMLNWSKEPATVEVPLADLRKIAKAWNT
jgi:hypothetical protein